MKDLGHEWIKIEQSPTVCSNRVLQFAPLVLVCNRWESMPPWDVTGWAQIFKKIQIFHLRSYNKLDCTSRILAFSYLKGILAFSYLKAFELWIHLSERDTLPEAMACHCKGIYYYRN